MLFKDKTKQKELEENGFVIIQLLNASELADLNSFYKSIHHNEPPLFIDNIHMTTWCEDASYKKSISDKLMLLFTDASKRFFENYRRLNHVFIVKKSGQHTTFKVHQDWNVVDETKYQSVNVWVPLHHVNESDGALWVLKGSHKINRAIRGAGYLFPEYGTYCKELESKAESVKLKAGEAIVFYHSVIHGSPPNLSGKNREAACFTVIPNEAPLCIYFQKNENEALEQHQPPDDFVYSYKDIRTESTINPPTQKAVRVFPSFKNEKVTPQELSVFLNPKASLFSRMFRK